MLQDAITPLVCRSTPRKRATGIDWLDDISDGGIPLEGLSLLEGDAGSGKTLLCCQIVGQLSRAGETAVFVTFEESPDTIIANTACFPWRLVGTEEGGRVHFIDARPDPDMQVSGDFDLAGLLAGVTALVRQTGASVVVFDGLDQLLTWLGSPEARQRELGRIGGWAESQRLAGLITARAAEGPVGEQAFTPMQFAVNMVMALRRRTHDAGLSRTLTILKYRGSMHSSMAHPYYVNGSGLQLLTNGVDMPVFSASSERVSAGMPRLDTVLGGGVYRGSVTLVSGVPGTGKSTLGALFLQAACVAGSRATWISFDEGAAQLLRNAASVRIHLGSHVESGQLAVLSMHSAGVSPERVLLRIVEHLDQHRPATIVIDPVSAFLTDETGAASGIMVERLVSELRKRQITTLLTSLVDAPTAISTRSGVSTIADNWILLTYVDRHGERNRALSVIKARGSTHSNQTREFLIGPGGCSLADVYTAGGDVVMGTARLEREARHRAANKAQIDEHQKRRAALTLRAREIQNTLGKMAAEGEAIEQEILNLAQLEENRITEEQKMLQDVRASRLADL